MKAIDRANKESIMSAVYTSVDQLIGKTPLLELAGLERDVVRLRNKLDKEVGPNPASAEA